MQFLAKKGRFKTLGKLRPVKNGEKPCERILIFAHTAWFCARFLRNFCPFSRFCKHAKISKVNAKFFCGVDFWKQTNAFFRRNSHKQLIANHLANPLKTRLFSSKTSFVKNFSKYGGLKRPFCQYLSKKTVSSFWQIFRSLIRTFGFAEGTCVRKSEGKQVLFSFAFRSLIRTFASKLRTSIII